MKSYIKRKIKETSFLYFSLKIKNLISLPNWFLRGKPIPIPPIIKISILKKYQKKYNFPILIESGTYQGTTIYSLKNCFKKIYSIELSESLYKRAIKRLSKFNQINLLQGDSSKILPSLLKSINYPCFFWLDGHYSGGITAKGEINTPIMKELEVIANHSIKNHIIFIDDARCFNGTEGYPNLNILFKKIKKINKDYKITIKDDIIRAII